MQKGIGRNIGVVLLLPANLQSGKLHFYPEAEARWYQGPTAKEAGSSKESKQEGL